MSDDDQRARGRRLCASCKQPAVTCVHVTQHLLNGVMPIGRTYVHRCGGCQATFESESPFRTVYELTFGLAALLFGGLGAVFVVAWAIDFANGVRGMPSLYQMGIGAVMIALLAAGVFVPIRSAARMVALFRNPPA
jgi:hypothetical protein